MCNDSPPCPLRMSLVMRTHSARCPRVERQAVPARRPGSWKECSVQLTHTPLCQPPCAVEPAAGARGLAVELTALPHWTGLLADGFFWVRSVIPSCIKDLNLKHQDLPFPSASYSVCLFSGLSLVSFRAC